MILKIPSHNIYDIPTNDILKKNRITKSTISANLMSAKVGSLLEQEEYVFNITRGTPHRILFKNLYDNQEKNNGVKFTKQDNTTPSGINEEVTGDFSIKISKNVLDKNFLDYITFDIEVSWCYSLYINDTYMDSYETSITPASFLLTGISRVISRNSDDSVLIVKLTLPYRGTEYEGDFRREYYAQTCRVSLIGEYIEGAEEVVSMGEGENVYKNETSEIFQFVTETPNWDKDRFLNGYLQQQIDTYKNGKQTVELLCDISDYYDYETGQKVISLEKPEIIQNGTIVVPFVAPDTPLAQKSNGQPKSFVVLSNNLIFDGAIFQKIYISEV